MKYPIVVLSLMLISTYILAESNVVQRNTLKRGDPFPLNSKYKFIAINEKGTLLVDPKTCEFKIYRQEVYVSLVGAAPNEVYFIELPDGRTVTGRFNDFNREKKILSCFHSLSNKPQNSNWKTFANQSGLTNCLERNGRPVADTITYIPNQEYFKNCQNPSESSCQKTERMIRMNSQAGISFYTKGKAKKIDSENGWFPIMPTDLKIIDRDSYALCEPRSTQTTKPAQSKHSVK